MISGIRGTLVSKLPGILHVETGGLTYRVLTSQHSVEQTGSAGSEVSLFTHLHVREDQLTLFGFTSQEELQCFELLMGVSGIGPRVALGLLSAGRPDDIYGAIAAEDTAFLSKMPGIGKKTAGRIIFDLRGKLPAAAETGAMPGGAPAHTDDLEALEALQALGYTMAEAHVALSRLENRENQTVEERVFNALQLLAPTT